MRLASLTKDQLDPEQLELYQRILGGPRASGPQHFALTDESGALVGPFGIMLHAPALGRPLQDLGAAIRYQTGLSARVREIAILSVAARDRQRVRALRPRTRRPRGWADGQGAGRPRPRPLHEPTIRWTRPPTPCAIGSTPAGCLSRTRTSPTCAPGWATRRCSSSSSSWVTTGLYPELLHVFDVGAPLEDRADSVAGGATPPVPEG